MKLRLCITTIAVLAILWSLLVILSGRVLFETLVISKDDAISLMLAQVLLVPAVLYLALNRRR